MSGIVGVLSQPAVQQGIKNAMGVIIFEMGSIALHDAMRGKIYTKYAKAPGEPYSVVDRITFAFGQASLVLSAAVTPVGIWGISQVVNKIFTSAQLEKVFGSNTVFESNWKHPRHVVSLIAVGLALPLAFRRFFIPPTEGRAKALQDWVVFTIVFSRPVLHQGNLLAQKLFNNFRPLT